VIEEPFADLYVVAGREPGSARLYAMDLLNLELEPLSSRADILRIVAVCDDEPIVEVRPRAGLEGAQVMILRDGRLGFSETPPLEGCDRPAARAGELNVRGWTLVAISPNDRRGLFADGRELAVGVSPDFVPLEALGTAKLPIWSAVWPER
jgi:hypothetical protein